MGSGVDTQPKSGQSESRDSILRLLLKPLGKRGHCLLELSLGEWEARTAAATLPLGEEGLLDNKANHRGQRAKPEAWGCSRLNPAIPEVNPIPQVFSYKKPLKLSGLVCLASEPSQNPSGQSYFKVTHEGLPWWSSGKESTLQRSGCGFDPW